MLGLFESLTSLRASPFYGYAVSKFQVPVALPFGLRRAKG
jgi:hypothetical protein